VGFFTTKNDKNGSKMGSSTQKYARNDPFSSFLVVKKTHPKSSQIPNQTMARTGLGTSHGTNQHSFPKILFSGVFSYLLFFIWWLFSFQNIPLDHKIQFIFTNGIQNFTERSSTCVQSAQFVNKLPTLLTRNAYSD
jgi:hypothetical protein